MKLAIIIFSLCNIISMQANAADADDIKTVITAQNAGNLTASTWSTELLDYQAKYISENGVKGAKQAFIEHGGNATDWVESATYEANFVFIKGEKFGIIKSRMAIRPSNENMVVNTIRISAIRGGDMISVACVRQSDKEISLNDGPCDEAIRKNLGVTFSVFPNNASSNKETPNRELNALAAGANSFAKNMLMSIGAFLIASIPFIWMQRKQKNSPTARAYREGHLAFQNALDESSNPYFDKDGNLSKSWLDGYRNALKIRKKKES